VPGDGDGHCASGEGAVQAAHRLGIWASARLPPVEEITLRFADAGAGTPLGAGVHGIGRGGDGTMGIVDEREKALVQLCMDRRGVWLTVEEAAGSVHVNGRPVRRMAMLRVGDAIYVDGTEIVLVGSRSGDVPPRLASAPVEAGTDPRVVLRGVGGRYHGRSFTLERPRLVGRSVDADIRIEDSAFADRHARIDLSGDTIVLRDLGSAEGSIVNGEPVRDAVLKPGDQIVFDAHHRFVIEAPARTTAHDEALPADVAGGEHARQVLRNARSTRRLPWLLLAALLIAAALSALLLFGVSA
jgi:FHA domain-containing protein